MNFINLAPFAPPLDPRARQIKFPLILKEFDFAVLINSIIVPIIKINSTKKKTETTQDSPV